MNERLEILREELCEVYAENEELKDDVKFLKQELKESQEEAEYLQQELQEAQEVLDNIEDILIDELGEKLGIRVYNRIFGLD